MQCLPFFVLLLDPANTGGLARRCCTSILSLHNTHSINQAKRLVPNRGSGHLPAITFCILHASPAVSRRLDRSRHLPPYRPETFPDILRHRLHIVGLEHQQIPVLGHCLPGTRWRCYWPVREAAVISSNCSLFSLLSAWFLDVLTTLSQFLELHNIEHREKDAVDFCIPALMEMSVVPVLDGVA